MPNNKAPAQTARPSAPRCGAPCICKPMRRRMSSRTTSACGCWPAGQLARATRHGSDLHPDLPRVHGRAGAFVEDLVLEQAAQGVAQYVILGAGLDSFAQRRPDIASRMRVFEVDQPAPQEWKRRRLVELGYGVPEWLQLVPVDFEAGASAWQALAEAGFDATRPAFVASTGVSMYLTRTRRWPRFDRWPRWRPAPRSP